MFWRFWRVLALKLLSDEKCTRRKKGSTKSAIAETTHAVKTAFCELSRGKLSVTNWRAVKNLSTNGRITAGQSTRCSVTIAKHNNVDWVHEMASVSLHSTRKRMGFVASPGTKNDQFFSSRAPDAPGLTQSVILTLPYDMLLLCSFHNELRHEQIFPLICLSKQ